MNFSWLRLQYPLEDTFEEKRNTVFALSASAGLILIVLQPFGFSLAEQSLHFAILSLIGIISMGINFLYLPEFFPALFKENKWSVAKAILFLTYNFLIIGLWNHLYQVLFIEQNIFLISSGVQLLSSLIKTVAIGLVASGFLVLIRYNIRTRQHLQIAQELNESSINGSTSGIEGPHSVRLLLENKELILDRNDLLSIHAEGNYIALNIREADKSHLFRATMKQVEEMLVEFPEFFRCHRSHMVNLNAISFLKGNSQGLFAEVGDSSEKIPVARSKIKRLRDAYQQKQYTGKQFITN